MPVTRCTLKSEHAKPTATVLNPEQIKTILQRELDCANALNSELTAAILGYIAVKKDCARGTPTWKYI